MLRAASLPELHDSAASTTVNGGDGNGGEKSFSSIGDRLLFKRNANTSNGGRVHNSIPDRASLRSRLRLHAANRANRRGLINCFPCRGAYLLYFIILFVVFAFAMASVLLQSSIGRTVFSSRGSSSESEHHQKKRFVREGLRFGATLKFFPGERSRWLAEGHGLDHLRLRPRRGGLRAPRLALVLGNLKKNPQTLMLLTVTKNLRILGYAIKIYAVENGEAGSMWEQIGGNVSILGSEQYASVDWSIFEGIILSSLQAIEAIPSLMQEPFSSIPLIWIIQEDTLANRLPVYKEMRWQHLVSYWRDVFSRANAVTFIDFTLPMLYSVLDTGNFFVIPGSPVDVWAAERYIKAHAKHQLRAENGLPKDDMVVLVLGSSLIFDELSLDYTVAIHILGPLLVKYSRGSDVEVPVKFVFLCGDSTDNDALQEAVSRLGVSRDFVRHYGLNKDANSVLLMADIVLYCSPQDEQSFPPLLVKAMTFGLPIIIPDFPIMNKYVVDGASGIIFSKYDPEDLIRAFSLLVSDGKLSKLAQTVASSGRLLAKNMLASESITGYARLLENVLSFPSDTLLPGPISELQQKVWEWNLFRKETEPDMDDVFGMDEIDSSTVVYSLEEELTDIVDSTNYSENGTEIVVPDIPNELDWDVLREIETFEEYETLEMEEIQERMDGNPGIWNEIYRNARKSEKLKFETNERDEGELERTGQPVCIYEIYDGAGSWPFLHHGSLYRGLSLSTKSRRLRSDDVDAVARLPLLNESYYRNILCEIGGMFSVANKVDNIHQRPWIGFQSWRAAGRQASLSIKAEKVLEDMIQKETGNVMYFWARLDVVGGFTGRTDELPFWSMCDILNRGNCRTAFQDAFREMYALPSSVEVLPPMPEDGGHWSALHCWVMPTRPFLEFVMFSRMFVDSLDAFHTNSSQVSRCLFSSSKLEEKHCYCRMLELLVNVWAYHSAQKMVYIDPRTGSSQEQHTIEQRKGFMWEKYFNFTILKSMDEDLAEAVDDGDLPRDRWLWPFTGEVHWQGIYEREREERYRLKMDKKRKTREKLYERMKSGYRQKPLGGR